MRSMPMALSAAAPATVMAIADAPMEDKAMMAPARKAKGRDEAGSAESDSLPAPPAT